MREPGSLLREVRVEAGSANAGSVPQGLGIRKLWAAGRTPPASNRVKEVENSKGALAER